jgi:hypothetical protein
MSPSSSSESGMYTSPLASTLMRPVRLMRCPRTQIHSPQSRLFRFTRMSSIPPSSMLSLAPTPRRRIELIQLRRRRHLAPAAMAVKRRRFGWVAAPGTDADGGCAEGQGGGTRGGERAGR